MRKEAICVYALTEDQVSVAKPGEEEGARAPHWPVKCTKSHVFGAFEVDFWWKNKNSPPQRKLGTEVVK